MLAKAYAPAPKYRSQKKSDSGLSCGQTRLPHADTAAPGRRTDQKPQRLNITKTKYKNKTRFSSSASNIFVFFWFHFASASSVLIHASASALSPGDRFLPTIFDRYSRTVAVLPALSAAMTVSHNAISINASNCSFS